MTSQQKQIFTFWEPKECIPPYLRLCMETWEKFLPEYTVKVLDYSSIEEYLGKDYYDGYLYKNFSLPKQADAIRAALLNKFGGIWFDCDTIITSDKIKELINKDSGFIIAGKHIGFIVTKPNSYITTKWTEEIKINIQKHKDFKPDLFKKIFKNKEYSYYEGWDYLGNSILNKYLKKDSKHCHIISKKEIEMLPERIYGNKSIKNPINQYIDFYFNQPYNDKILDNNGGLIYLHNSWTPKKYKTMSREEFLKQDITLSKILKKILI